MPPRRRKPRIGLVLGGGAARGWAHIGAIRALEEAGIRPDVVCGTSIGALVGAVYANGDLDWLEDWVGRLTWQMVVRLLDLRFAGGLFGGRKVIEVFSNRFNGRDISELTMPFMAVATELDTGREVWLQEGGVVDAVRASIAIPGLFTPIWHDGVWLVDGGLTNPVPVSAARAMRADCVIAIDLNNDILNGRDLGGAISTITPRPVARAPVVDPVSAAIAASRRFGGPLWRWLQPPGPDAGEPPTTAGAGSLSASVAASDVRAPSMLSAIAQSLDIMQVRITRSRLAGEPADILIQPRLGGVGIFDFHRAPPAIAEGRAAVQMMLPAIRALLGIA
ncbi:MAG TPA: patatin-like phospholipase family protein [Paraburkholderia sp.]|jgi:NTE family protein|nr:patatin-like phospholipase family protein [Paraburkholderia sp.]